MTSGNTAARQLAADLNWAARRLEETNPDRSFDFSEGVDWAVAELRRLAAEAGSETNPDRNIQPGQVWADNDKRGYGRRIRVVAVDGTHATVTDGKRTSRIRLDRFRPTSTGYRLVQNADGTPAAPGGAR